MIPFIEFLEKSDLKVERWPLYYKRLKDLQAAYPDKKSYTMKDVENFCGKREDITKQMQIVIRYLRLNFMLKEQTATKKKSAKKDQRRVEDMVPVYLQSLRRKNYKPLSVEGAKVKLKSFLKYLATQQIEYIEEIDPHTIEGYKDYLYRLKSKWRDKNLDVYTQKRRLLRVKLFFKFLMDEEYIFTNPCFYMTLPRVEKKISKNVLTHNEMADFFSVIDVECVQGFIDRTIFEVLYSTGIRLNELYGLKIKHLNLEDNLLYVYDGKGRKDRACILTEVAKRYLEAYIEHIRPGRLPEKNTEYLIFKKDGGKLYGTAYMKKKLERYCYLADIDHRITPHAFRRSFATHLLNEGVDIRHIQKLMGHDSLNTTAEYIHVCLKDLRAVLVKFHPREKTYQDKDIKFRGDL